MKTTAKQLIAALAIAFCPLSLTAQDTLHLTEPSQNYLCMHRDLFSRQNEGDTLDRWTAGIGSSEAADQEAFYMYTDTAMIVYGIAVSAFVDEIIETGVVYTSLDSTYDYLRLYEADANTLRQVGEDLKLCLSDSPDYYMDLALRRCLWGPGAPQMPAYPVYERYFSKPLVVEDSFYVGRKFCSGRRNSNGYPAYMSRGVCLYGSTNCASDITCNYAQSHGVPGSDMFDTANFFWHYYPNYELGCIFIFPILAPSDSTSHTGSDETGVGIQRIEDRLVGVMPNPATKEVKVVSSFGLRHIDAYDAAGRRVLSRDAQGLQTHLDVGAWPRGVYTLHILTPAGTTVKKLLVE